MKTNALLLILATALTAGAQTALQPMDLYHVTTPFTTWQILLGDSSYSHGSLDETIAVDPISLTIRQIGIVSLDQADHIGANGITATSFSFDTGWVPINADSTFELGSWGYPVNDQLAASQHGQQDIFTFGGSTAQHSLGYISSLAADKIVLSGLACAATGTDTGPLLGYLNLGQGQSLTADVVVAPEPSVALLAVAFVVLSVWRKRYDKP